MRVRPGRLGAGSHLGMPEAGARALKILLPTGSLRLKDSPTVVGARDGTRFSSGNQLDQWLSGGKH